MLRTQIQLSEEQQKRLKRLASERGLSLAQLIREGVDLVLQRAEHEKRWNRLWEVVGSCHEADAITDVSQRHDGYLVDLYRGDDGLR